MNHVDPEIHYRHVRTHSDSLFWGTLIILIGVAWLGINLGYFDSNVWYELFRLWPVLLIIWGLNILVRRTPLQFLVYVTPLILVAAFIWVLAGKPMSFTPSPSGPKLVWTEPSSRSSSELTEYHYVLPREEGVEELSADVDAGAAEVTIDTLGEESGSLAEVDYLTSRGEPDVKMKVDGETAYLDVPSRARTRVGAPIADVEEMQVRLAATLPLHLQLNAGASAVEADLRRSVLRSLELNGGAAAMEVMLPEAGDSGYRVGISAGAASLKLRLPQDTPVYLKSTSALSATNFGESGLLRREGHWESPNYDPERPCASIELEGALSSISLVFEP